MDEGVDTVIGIKVQCYRYKLYSFYEYVAINSAEWAMGWGSSFVAAPSEVPHILLATKRYPSSVNVVYLSVKYVDLEWLDVFTWCGSNGLLEAASDLLPRVSYRSFSLKYFFFFIAYPVASRISVSSSCDDGFIFLPQNSTTWKRLQYLICLFTEGFSLQLPCHHLHTMVFWSLYPNG